MIDMAMVSIRPATEDDEPFVLAAYLNGNFYSDSFIRQEFPKGKTQYFKAAGDYIKNIMAMPNTYVDIACLADSSCLIFGYAITNGRNVVWCYVKEAYRSKGIGNALLSRHKITHYTNYTKSGRAIAIGKGLTFDPAVKLT